MAPLRDDSAERVGPSKGDKEAVESLRIATTAITREYARERREAAKIKEKAMFMDATERWEIATRHVREGDRRYLNIKAGLDRPIRTDDDDLAEARELLASWIALQVKADKAALSSTSAAEMKEKTKAILNDEMDPVLKKLERLSYRIEAKYPQVDILAFLHRR